ncbi:aromatic acid exporter family protein [Fusibacter sp. 3D3]|uniref:aromatic acid exporter family protein n=1 Tax=Fusibacter sp. 3D3 TaxID=1048380 RepID=UPI000853AEA9|nr:aromatic acid exporter family protein [Fusibacter sp. 3D3]GAU79383.1 hypothetical protein F3D3_4044 [Fusibacter sp. 3D3]
MDSIKKRILLSREAMLFDSPLYILKSFMSVMTAYLLFHNHSIIGKDMISLLFGMMLTLEPVTVSGLRSGISQLKASWLGGVTSAVVLAIFGVNWITIPLAVAITIYVSLIGNWKEVSAVAIFTAIYMTQYIQYNASGMPSVLLTLRLRLLALTAGIIIAVFYNFVFSKFFYKKMLHKRLTYVLEKMHYFLTTYQSVSDFNTLNRIKNEAMSLFKDIDVIFSHTPDLRMNANSQVRLISELKNLNHYIIEIILYSMTPQNERVAIDEVVVAYENLMKLHENLRVEELPDHMSPETHNERAVYYSAVLLLTIEKIESVIKA